jgi:predicted transcriptional regulator
MARTAVTGKDTLLAIKVVSLHPDLTRTDIKVGVTIIEHFNRGTGQCDPGIDRLAKLLNLSRRTIIRSIGRLNDMSLIHVTRHGGGSARNSYEPDWEHLTAREQAWQQRFRANALDWMTTDGDQRCQTGAEPSDGLVSQTYALNLPKQTFADRHESTRPAPTIVPSSATAARAAVQRRLATALLTYCGSPQPYARAIELIDDETQELAIVTELRRRGTGFNVIKLHLNGRHLVDGERSKIADPSNSLEAARYSTSHDTPGRQSEAKVDEG